MTVPGHTTTGPRVGGLILAGGRSVRFGAEKAMQGLGGEPLVGWSLAALSACCESTAISAPRASGAAAFALTRGVTLLEDDPDHPRGPLTGVAAGLAWANDLGFEILATQPCDTPLATVKMVKTLLAGLGDANAAFAVTEDGPQGLCAIWGVSLGQSRLSRLTRGERPAVHRSLRAARARAIPLPDDASFQNANTREALATMKTRPPWGERA